jgi:GT2 family glycosyltransferase
MPHPLVSVIVLNWNGKVHLLECCGSVLKTAYAPLEIIVADNGSTDGSLEAVRSHYPSVVVLKNGSNLGYAEGNNRAVAIAKGDYVVTLNNDVVVETDWLDKPIEYLEKKVEGLFAVCGRQMNYYNRLIIDSLFHYPGPEMVFLRAGHGTTLEQNSGIAVPGRVIAVNGGSAIYRKKMFKELGGFDREYRFYGEEADLCMRAFLRGWQCLFVPQSVVYHKEGESFKKSKGKNLYYHERNRMWFLFKFFPCTFLARNIVPLALEEMRTIKRDVFRERATLRYVKARVLGFAGIFKYIHERGKNVRMFRGREKEFVEFQKKKILPL